MDVWHYAAIKRQPENSEL